MLIFFVDTLATLRAAGELRSVHLGNPGELGVIEMKLFFKPGQFGLLLTSDGAARGCADEVKAKITQQGDCDPGQQNDPRALHIQ